MNRIKGQFQKHRGITAALLSMMDFVLLQIELNGLAMRTLENGALRLVWIFPRSYQSSAAVFILWLALFALRFKAPEDSRVHLHRFEKVFAFIFAAAFVICRSYWESFSFDLICGNRHCLAISLFSAAALGSVMINMLRWGKMLLHGFLDKGIRLPKLWQRHPFLFPLIIILLCWLPHAVAKYPGGIEWDSFCQLHQPLGLHPMTNHWPVSSSMLFAGLFSLGRLILGGNNAGLFFLILCYMLICACAFAYCLKTLHRLKTNDGVLVLLLLFFCFSTLVTKYTTSLNKDAIFACAVLTELCLLALMLYKRESLGPERLILFAAVGLIMGILRSNGPYILMFNGAAMLLAWLIRRDRLFIKLAAATAAAYLMCLCYLGLLSVFNIPGPSTGEALSLPFMQTARFVIEHPEEISEEDKEIIDAVLCYDTIAELYEPWISDRIKAGYHGDGESLARYMGMWLRQGLRHPGTYVSATMSNVCGYFYPGARDEYNGIFVQYDMTSPLIDSNVKLFTLTEEQEARRLQIIDKYIGLIWVFESCPIFFPFCNCGAQLWLMLYMLACALFKKKGKLLLLLVASAVSLLVCVAGPTFVQNGVRYALPVIYLNPLLFGLLAVERGCERKGETADAYS